MGDGSDKTVVRASTGIMYDQAILGGYEQALQLAGSPRAPVYTFSGTSTPARRRFPASVATAAPLAVAVAVGRRSGLRRRAHVAGERAARARVRQRHDGVGQRDVREGRSDLPVVTDINLINPIGTLADGRPIYNTAVSAATRLDPRFNHIQQVQSIGDSTFKSMTVQASKRLAQGLTFNVQYSLGKGLDNTPLLTQLTVQSESGPVGPEQHRSRPRSEPARHAPQLHRQRRLHVGEPLVATRSFGSLLSGNQIGVLLQFNSGLPVNIPANRRPERRRHRAAIGRLFVARNSLYLPVRKNVDLRYTRVDPDSRVGARAKSSRSSRTCSTPSSCRASRPAATVDALGNPTTPIPADPYQFLNPSGAEQRKFQLGFKVRF